jgi:hypothetical protein
MDQQVESLRAQLETIAGAGVVAASDPSDANQSDFDEEQAMFGAHTPVWSEPTAPGANEPSWAEPEPSADADWDQEPAPSEAPIEWEQPAAPESESTIGHRVEEPAAEAAPHKQDPPPSDEGSNELTATFAGEEIVGVLRAAEDAARRMVERAKATADQQMADVVRRRQELDAEAARLSAWREQVGAVIRSMASEIEVFKAGLEEIPQRLSEAFAPLAQRIPSMQQDIAALAGALGGASLAPNPESPEDRQQLAG